MSEPKRYSCLNYTTSRGETRRGVMGLRTDGRYVLYSDYVALAKSRDEWREKAIGARERVRELEEALKSTQECFDDDNAKLAEQILEIDRLREALEKARPYVSGYAVGSERNLKWLDAAQAEEVSDE